MDIKYINGFFHGTNIDGSDIEQVRNVVIAVRNEGIPFKGTPMDMAIDIMAHISRWIPEAANLSPVILQSSGGVNRNGQYATEVVFQAVQAPF